ncbi:ABC transporter ATP-binding protein [Acetonema longum]|uniref:ABC transporter ATP-binding/permease protein n=1 Tax=Acetonema longum DSM 6540 TaxID=1009370 RepID=F7NME1_9FIRM|nr:ABC transporter ATP-binding protein [Acetonema longum]EGO62786.1 ABC transporter ATP-binding/permease protein [Acetonema longum DSM 6540]
MIGTIRLLLGKDIRRLWPPIGLMMLDALISMVFYGVLYLLILDLMNATFSLHKLGLYTLVLLAAFLLRCAATATGYTMYHVLGSDIIKTMRLNLGNHLKNLYLGYFDKNSMGHLLGVMTHDVADFERVITHYMGDLIKAVFLSVYLVAVAFWIDYRLALVQLTFILGGLLILWAASRVVTRLGIRKRRVIGQVVSRIVEYISGIRVFKAFNQTGSRFQRLEQSFRSFKRESIILEAGIAPFVMVFAILADLGFPLVMISGAGLLLEQTLTKELFVIFLIQSLALSNVLKAFSGQYHEFRYFELAARRLVDTYARPEIGFAAEALPPERYDIEFRDVSFAYEPGTPVLKNIRFVAKEGTTTALVGSSGSGKTTVTSLIARFWDVTSGRIFIGGRDIRDLNPDRLLAKISMVFQDVYLLNDTIYNNIKIGAPDAGREEVIRAAELAHCRQFIEKLPGGFDTLVGEGGSTLSGGEKQRLSIARAIIKNAPIVLLDEATASLDADNEHEIHRSLQQLTTGKTVVVIAHRLNTIRDADQIIVLEEGGIAEKGSHRELLAGGGAYCRMVGTLAAAKSWKI